MMASPDFHRREPVWRRLLRAARALDDHWIGDLIGALTGGDESASYAYGSFTIAVRPA